MEKMQNNTDLEQSLEQSLDQDVRSFSVSFVCLHAATQNANPSRTWFWFWNIHNTALNMYFLLLLLRSSSH